MYFDSYMSDDENYYMKTSLISKNASILNVVLFHQIQYMPAYQISVRV